MPIRRNSKRKKQGNSPEFHDKNNSGLSAEEIKKQLHNTEDFKFREIKVNQQQYIIFYIAPLIDQDKIESKIIEPLTESKNGDMMQVLWSLEQKTANKIDEVINGLLDGNCFLIKKEDQEQGGLLLNANASHGRDIAQPETEKTVLGAHEGFVEDMNKNIFLLRKRTKSPDFKIKMYTLGNETKTDAAVLFLDNLADPKIVRKIDERLKSIDLDSIRSAGDVRDCIEDHSLSPFPQLLITERTDRSAANLMDGKVVLIIDGSPTVFILPATFMQFFQSPDDYISRWHTGSLYRLIRFFSYVNSLVLPSFYIAAVSFHYEIFPVEFIYSLQSSLSYVPFRPIMEVIFMWFSLELLREAAIRLPQSIAQTFGIVGGLLVGTAMVEAGVVSYGGLIIVAITAVSSFVQVNSEISTSIRNIGFPLMFLAALFGFLGIFIGILFLLIHLSRITSFGVPYFTPFAPLKIYELKDLIRLPVWIKIKDQKNSFNIEIDNKSREWKSNESEEPY